MQSSAKEKTWGDQVDEKISKLPVIATEFLRRSSLFQSDPIDDQIKEEKQKSSSRRTVLVMGECQKSVHSFWKLMADCQEITLEDEAVPEYHQWVQVSATRMIKTVADTVHQKVLEHNGEDLKAIQSIQDCIEENKDHPESTLPKVSRMMLDYWNTHSLESLALNQVKDPDELRSILYLFENLERISNPSYTPTMMDVLELNADKHGYQEFKLSWEIPNLRVIYPGPQNACCRKWIHQFENALSLIFVLDVTAYDCASMDDPSQTRMMESLELFESAINSEYVQKSSLILLLVNINKFKEKVKRVPLKKYFPDFLGGKDGNKAVKYILAQFDDLNRQKVPLFICSCELNDPATLKSVQSALQETLVTKGFRHAGLAYKRRESQTLVTSVDGESCSDTLVF